MTEFTTGERQGRETGGQSSVLVREKDDSGDPPPRLHGESRGLRQGGTAEASWGKVFLQCNGGREGMEESVGREVLCREQSKELPDGMSCSVLSLSLHLRSHRLSRREKRWKKAMGERMRERGRERGRERKSFPSDFPCCSLLPLVSCPRPFPLSPSSSSPSSHPPVIPSSLITAERWPSQAAAGTLDSLFIHATGGGIGDVQGERRRHRVWGQSSAWNREA